MELIVIAHKNEANSFIKNLNLVKNESSSIHFYSNENIVLLICGQGIENVRINLSKYLKIHFKKISRIVNYGIAGKLDGSIQLNTIYSIETVALYDGTLLDFRQKLKCLKNAKNCITSVIPVSNHDLAESLSNNAAIVDMELHEIVKIAGLYKIPVWSFKLISDDARNPVSLKEIKNKSMRFAEQLYNSYKNEFNRIIKGQQSDLV